MATEQQTGNQQVTNYNPYHQHQHQHHHHHHHHHYRDVGEVITDMKRRNKIIRNIALTVAIVLALAIICYILWLQNVE